MVILDEYQRKCVKLLRIANGKLKSVAFLTEFTLVESGNYFGAIFLPSFLETNIGCHE